MATYTYVEIDGQRVEEHVAEHFEKMAAAFKAHFGLELLVTSGTRTHEQQQALYDAGRTKAKPGQSNHNEDGPLGGPRALDLRDSGKDPGVQYIGTVRSNWLKNNAPKFGFNLAGRFFTPPEGWHYEFTGSLTPSAPAKVEAASSTSTSKATSNKFGLDDVRGLQKIANLFTTGQKTDIDNDWGPLSEAGFDRFLLSKYGNSQNTGLARWLRKRWGYEGNDVYGPNMKAALKRANEANFREL